MPRAKRSRSYKPFTRRRVKRRRKTPLYKRRQYTRLRRIARLANETKRLHFPAIHSTVVNTTWDLNVFGIAQGSSSATRDGNKCAITRLDLNGYFTSDANTLSYVRVMVLWSRETPDINDMPTDLDADWDYSGVTQYYRKIMDRVYKLAPVTIGSGSIANKRIFRKSIRGWFRQRYTAGTAADLKDGYLTVAFISDKNIVDEPTFNLDGRLYFKDY